MRLTHSFPHLRHLQIMMAGIFIPTFRMIAPFVIESKQCF